MPVPSPAPGPGQLTNLPQQDPLLFNNNNDNNSADETRSGGVKLKINHGTFISPKYNHTQPSSSSSYSYTHSLHVKQSLYLFLERYSDELFAAALLLMIPIAIGVVELAEHIGRSMAVEEFPERGREKRRLASLKEREEWVLRRKERERRLERSRSWWKLSRP
ncbi:hypothetical protein BJX61DRAFT_541136 [Aspergillus egyptiacus]|nr:hypothetical protein BJX61DRAFT_541136 [Aspergillus egyptiacus]